MMPKKNGFEVIKEIRKISVVPILILSAKNSDTDKALGLGFGADDYVEKPFSIIELTARVKAILRRATRYSAPIENQNKKIKGLEIDTEAMTVKRDGKDINLTNKEFEILKLFITNPKKVFTKANIYESVWKESYYGDENVINVHIRRLREKIEKVPPKPEIIKTLWGIGYKCGDIE